VKQIFCTALFIFLSTSVWATGWSPEDPLMPTGDSTQDTENLQAKLHDSKLGKGETLYLGPGTFMIHSVTGRQSIDEAAPSYSTELFNGNIQGAGKDVTILKGVRGPNNEDFEPINEQWPGDPEPSRTYAVMLIEQLYLGLKDLTFDSESDLLDDPDNGMWLDPWRGHNGYGGRGLTLFVGTGSVYGGPNELIGTDITNVHFKGSLDSNGDPETAHLFQQWGDVGGMHNVTNCEFENSSNGALQFFGLANATFNVGGGPKDKVKITNALQGGLQIACRNCAVNVSRIETQDAAGVFFQTNGHSTLTVIHSDIRIRPASVYAGVELMGNWGDLSFVIEKNKFHSEDAWLWGPIFSDVANQNGLIADNKFTGRGPAAMYLGVYSWHPGSVTIRGNKFDNWETTSDPWGLGTAPIWLGPFIVDSIVVGGKNKVNVFDEPAYDTNWNPLYNDDGKPLTIPGYGTRIPPEEIDNLVLKNNTITGVK